MNKPILITGASGFVGQVIVPELVNAGYEVLLCGRDAERLETLFPAHAVCHPGEIAANAKGCSALLHLAVKNNDQPGTDEDFQNANVTQLQDVLEQARLAGIQSIIYPTSLHADPHAKTSYGRSKYAAEQLLAQSEGFTLHLLRLPAVYTERFQGRLSVLNKVPAFMRPLVRQALGTLKPMLHISGLSAAVLRALQSPVSSAELVTDDADKNLVYRFAKRTLDLAFALFILVFFWWLLLGVWAAVKLDSQGPGIFAQTRLGQHQRPFVCYKFRTMIKGTKQAGTHDVSQASVTRMGRFLRGSKIDELPQIWNILKGELSLVGPRPGLPMQRELTAARAAQGVYAISPGITGLGQVQGVDMSDSEKLAQLDSTYVKTRTLLLDLRIILATGLGKGLGDRIAQVREPST